MGLWLITDPTSKMIYGTVQAGDSQTAAARAVDGGEADWFWQAEPDEHQQLSVHPSFTLADGIWREAAPGTPLYADGGGDYQVSEGLGRRWWLMNKDGTFALFNVAWYVTDDTSFVDEPKGPRLERQEEYLICTDLREPGGTEVWADYRYVIEQDRIYDHEPTVAQAAAGFQQSSITWDGKEFR